MQSIFHHHHQQQYRLYTNGRRRQLLKYVCCASDTDIFEYRSGATASTPDNHRRQSIEQRGYSLISAQLQPTVCYSLQQQQLQPTEHLEQLRWYSTTRPMFKRGRKNMIDRLYNEEMLKTTIGGEVTDMMDFLQSVQTSKAPPPNELFDRQSKQSPPPTEIITDYQYNDDAATKNTDTITSSSSSSSNRSDEDDDHRNATVARREIFDFNIRRDHEYDFEIKPPRNTPLITNRRQNALSTTTTATATQGTQSYTKTTVSRRSGRDGSYTSVTTISNSSSNRSDKNFGWGNSDDDDDDDDDDDIKELFTDTDDEDFFSDSDDDNDGSSIIDMPTSASSTNKQRQLPPPPSSPPQPNTTAQQRSSQFRVNDEPKPSTTQQRLSQFREYDEPSPPKTTTKAKSSSSSSWSISLNDNDSDINHADRQIDVVDAEREETLNTEDHQFSTSPEVLDEFDQEETAETSFIVTEAEEEENQDDMVNINNYYQSTNERYVPKQLNNWWDRDDDLVDKAKRKMKLATLRKAQDNPLHKRCKTCPVCKRQFKGHAAMVDHAINKGMCSKQIEISLQEQLKAQRVELKTKKKEKKKRKKNVDIDDLF